MEIGPVISIDIQVSNGSTVARYPEEGVAMYHLDINIGMKINFNILFSVMLV